MWQLSASTDSHTGEGACKEYVSSPCQIQAKSGNLQKSFMNAMFALLVRGWLE